MSRAVEIGVWKRFASLPVCCENGVWAFAKEPKFSQSFFTFLVGIHAVALASVLIVSGVVCVDVCAFNDMSGLASGWAGKAPSHFGSREKVVRKVVISKRSQ